MSLLPAGQFDSYKTMTSRHTASSPLTDGQFERIAKALSDPRRFALLETIGTSRFCPNAQLCEHFPVSKATISHHLKELVQAGLVHSERDGQYVHFRARPEVLQAYTAELLRRVGA